MTRVTATNAQALHPGGIGPPGVYVAAHAFCFPGSGGRLRGV
ncbi:hypothetical protein [Corallococcus sp. CA047B]|nr:hypothetical protein [Corallococcus sp. CA047B]